MPRNSFTVRSEDLSTEGNASSKEKIEIKIPLLGDHLKSEAMSLVICKYLTSVELSRVAGSIDTKDISF